MVERIKGLLETDDWTEAVEESRLRDGGEKKAHKETQWKFLPDMSKCYPATSPLDGVNFQEYREGLCLSFLKNVALVLLLCTSWPIQLRSLSSTLNQNNLSSLLSFMLNMPLFRPNYKLCKRLLVFGNKQIGCLVQHSCWKQQQNTLLKQI